MRRCDEEGSEVADSADRLYMTVLVGQVEDYTPKLQDKIKKKREDRISITRRLPKVNRQLAERLLAEKQRKGKGKGAAASGGAGPSDEAFANPMGDDRFAAMFKDENFNVDQESEEWKLRHPSGEAGAKRRERERDMDMDSDEEEDGEGGDHAVNERFNLVEDDEAADDEEEVEGR